MRKHLTMDILLATANVGSIFEEPDVMLKGWLNEFLTTISDLKPQFIALHCQEVGGKNYENSMQYVGGFVESILNAVEGSGFTKSLIVLDEDYSVAENFTALGNIYLVHKDLDDCSVWNFSDGKFEEWRGKKLFSGCIESAPLLEKAKFPQEFFPECKWSRKGFLRTRWRLGGSVFDLVNIHLFHDASNIVASQSFPNPYSLNRRRALDHTVQRFFHDGLDNVPVFFFGDFNFRLDTGNVIKACTGSEVAASAANPDVTEACQFFGENNELVFTLGKKAFSRLDHDEYFLKDNGSWLLQYDREMEDFRGTLFEFPIGFPPTYPYEEDVKAPSALMKTRCPSWCDRVLLSHSARLLVDNPSSVNYGMIGFGTCTGDHKPIFLRFRMKRDMGDGKDIVWERQDSLRNRSSVPPTAAVCAAAIINRKGKSFVDGRKAHVSSLDSFLPPSSAGDFLCSSCRMTPLDRSQSERKRPSPSQSLLNRRSHQIASTTLSAESNTCRNCKRARTGPRVRMHLLARGSSKRPLSHHSSSDEEWFEKVVEPNGNASDSSSNGQPDDPAPPVATATATASVDAKASRRKKSCCTIA